MATIGGIPMKLRLRIEAGIGQTLTDIGHADLDVTLPVQVKPTPHGPGLSLTIDADEMQRTLTTAVEAFENALDRSQR